MTLPPPEEKNRSQYDTTLKDLFAAPPQRLLQLLIGRPAKELLPVEFSSTQKRHPDLVFLLDDDSIFHLEPQSGPEPMAWRMLTYYFYFVTFINQGLLTLKKL
ncbi:MAG: hypothetical protein HQL84_12360, partial [Magnetococcales bacterium]|nr:hypothetical protein [Magnetococcales bacterium]MBF0150827.1 hypothetical protein [Magnetococcales bacterium]